MQPRGELPGSSGSVVAIWDGKAVRQRCSLVVSFRAAAVPSWRYGMARLLGCLGVGPSCIGLFAVLDSPFEEGFAVSRTGSFVNQCLVHHIYRDVSLDLKPIYSNRLLYATCVCFLSYQLLCYSDLLCNMSYHPENRYDQNSDDDDEAEPPYTAILQSVPLGTDEEIAGCSIR